MSPTPCVVRLGIVVTSIACLMTCLPVAAAEPVKAKAPAKQLGENIGRFFEDLIGPNEVAEREALRTERLTIHPAQASLPLLKYSPWYSAERRTTGNAAPAYLRAFAALDRQALRGDEWYEWLNEPLEELPQEAVTEWLQRAKLETCVRQLRQAAGYTTCDWGLPDDRQADLSTAVDVVVQITGGARELTRVLLIQIRLHLARREFDQAASLMRLLNGLGRHLTESPVLSHSMAGLTCIALQRTVLVDWVSLPDAPSLFWSLAARPRPIGDMTNMILAEATSPDDYAFLPTRIALQRELADDEYRRALQALPLWVDGLGGSLWGIKPLSDEADAELLRRFRDCETAAYAILAKHGYTAEKLKQMSERRQMLIYSHCKYDELRDEMLRWLLMPPTEGTPGADAMRENLRRLESSGEEVIPWASMYLPALAYAKRAETQYERLFDAFTLVEAIRLHVADSQGELPASLDAIKLVPVRNLDVVANRPFEYHVEANRAFLRLPNEYAGEKTSWHTFELTVADGGDVR